MAEPTEDTGIRLAREAEYQNSRTTGKRAGDDEARGKFYYLAATARYEFDRRVESLTKNSRVLVVGCAEGGVTPSIRRGAVHALGVDIAEEPIRKLAKAIEEEGLADRAKVMVANAENLPDIDQQSFDLIYCTGVLHHLNIETAMKEWCRILDRNGSVVMLEPMAYSPFVAIYRFFTPSMRSVDEHPLKPRDFKILHNYFEYVIFESYVLTSIASLIWAYTPNIFSLREKSCHFLETVDRKLTNWCPLLRYLCWTSVIELKRPK